ncbi:MAG: hypothetical protein ACKVYV_18550 [Limisphaerales bacterium]
MRCLLVLALTAMPRVPAQAPLYENFGLVITAPQVDATAFVNRGTFDLFTSEPFETQNTRFFTNFNSMTGDPGYRFEFIGVDGLRQPADVIVNRGQIIAESSGFSDPNIGGFRGGSHLYLSASNVVNTGLLEVDSEGIVDVRGQNVSLTRSGIRATLPVAASSISSRGDLVFFNDGIYYLNAFGVNDLYAGTGLNGAHSSDGSAVQNGPNIPLNVNNLTLPAPRSPGHQVILGGFTNLLSIPLTPGFYGAWVYTNQLSDTNFVVQVVFVKTNSFDTNLTSDVRFADNPDGLVPGTKTAIVEVGLSDVDAVTGDVVTNRIYILDTLATVTNSVLYTNFFNTNIFRTSTLEVTRGRLLEWVTADLTNATYTPNIFTEGLDLTVVTNNYAGYGFSIGNPQTGGIGGGGGGGGVIGGGGGLTFFGFGSAEAALVFGGALDPRLTDITNQTGQVQIQADQLDLHLLRLKADGVVTLSATDFSGRDPRRLDAPAFRLDLQKKAGTMTVSNVVPSTVRRLDGFFYCYSAVWTNTAVGTAPDGSTNTLEFRYHTLIVDRAVDSIRPVDSLEVTLKATNVVWGDNMTVTRSLLIDAVGFQNSGSIDFATGGSIGRANLPRLRYLTNSGTFSVDNVMDLGADTTNGWANILNTGTLQANGIRARSAIVENLGTIEATQDILTIVGNDVKFDHQPDNPLALRGTVSARNDITIQANDFKSRNTDISAGVVVTNPITGAINYALGSLIFDVPTRLSDGGVDAANQWSCVDGFALLQKPQFGDLLGTTITVNGPRFGDVASLWAAEDRGETPAGFSNNVAVGRLVLNGQLLTLFGFAGPTPGRALYVDVLELNGDATNALENIFIAPDFTLYFADSVGVAPEDLDGLSDGRLRWVQDYAGPGSSVLVRLAGGNQVRMNRALVGSRTIDSDGDGTPNGLDATPFEPAALKVKMNVRRTSAQADVTWFASPGRSYRVEYSTDLAGDVWTPLTTVTNDQPSPRDMAAQDSVAVGGPSRFYRVVEVR